MYGSHGAFQRLKLSTTSHREPRMSQREWMSLYGTTNNLSRVSAAERQQRRGALPLTTAQLNSRPHRSDSQALTVAAMVRAANAARQAEAERARHSAAEEQSGRRAGEERKQLEEDGDDAQYSSADEEEDAAEEARPSSGIERQARADRRVQQLRKRHKAEQDAQRRKREKTRRTRTLTRSQSDIQPAEEEKEVAEAATEERKPTVALPSLGGANVEDIRERTRLLLREALVKTDTDATEEVKAAETERQRRLQQQHSGSKAHKRKRQDEEEAEADEARDEESEDAYSLLASDIEQSLYEQHSFSHGTAYRQHSRSVLFSLVNNAQLTPALLSGVTLSPQQLVALPTAQLASADVAQLRAAEQREATRDLVLGMGEGSKSSEYTCSGCGGRDTEWWLVKEARDIRKADVWGSGGDDGKTIILIRCCKCSHEWRKEV